MEVINCSNGFIKTWQLCSMILLVQKSANVQKYGIESSFLQIWDLLPILHFFLPLYMLTSEVVVLNSYHSDRKSIQCSQYRDTRVLTHPMFQVMLDPNLKGGPIKCIQPSNLLSVCTSTRKRHNKMISRLISNLIYCFAGIMSSP